MSATTVRASLPVTNVLAPINWKTPVVYGLIAVLGLVFFGLLADGGQISSFKISATGADALTVWHLPSKLTAIILTVMALALAALSYSNAQARQRTGPWLAITFAALMVFAFLTWAMAGTQRELPVTGLLSATLFLAVPLVFGAMSGLVAERSGVINIAIEGQLLSGAFLGAVVASITDNPWAGLVAAPVAGVVLAALLVLFSIVYRVDQIIVGVVLNVLALGLTSYLFSTVLSEDSALLNSPPRLPIVAVPLLSQIPVLGPVLFKQTVLVYIMYVAVAVLTVMLFRSRWGLRMRACGEHPKAADTVGINVNRTRVNAVLLSGAIAGLGGAFYTVGSGLAFGKEMTNGNGYIALAAMILGRWRPTGALAAALLFGFAYSVQQQFSVIGTAIPSQLMLMLPYLATIFAVAGIVGKVRPPAQEGIPYVK